MPIGKPGRDSAVRSPLIRLLPCRAPRRVCHRTTFLLTRKAARAERGHLNGRRVRLTEDNVGRTRVLPPVGVSERCTNQHVRLPIAIDVPRARHRVAKSVYRPPRQFGSHTTQAQPDPRSPCRPCQRRRRPNPKTGAHCSKRRSRPPARHRVKLGPSLHGAVERQHDAAEKERDACDGDGRPLRPRELPRP
jgi:hypothetical protein